MIRYSKQYWGLLTLSRWYGSAFLRALPFSMASSIFAGLLQAFWGDTLHTQWNHPYPYQAFAFIAGFMIVFRCASSSPMRNRSGPPAGVCLPAAQHAQPGSLAARSSPTQQFS
jgi:hypothetical protein